MNVVLFSPDVNVVLFSPDVNVVLFSPDMNVTMNHRRLCSRSLCHKLNNIGHVTDKLPYPLHT